MLTHFTAYAIIVDLCMAVLEYIALILAIITHTCELLLIINQVIKYIQHISIIKFKADAGSDIKTGSFPDYPQGGALIYVSAC